MTTRLDDVAELAGGLRTAVARLSHLLHGPSARLGVTPTRLTALVTLDRHGPLRPGDLAARLNITAASMSRLAEALEDEGWVRRTPDPEDRRACLLNLREEGTAKLDSTRREGTSELASAIRDLSAADRRRLAEALPVLVELADRRSEPAQ